MEMQDLKRNEAVHKSLREKSIRLEQERLHEANAKLIDKLLSAYEYITSYRKPDTTVKKLKEEYTKNIYYKHITQKSLRTQKTPLKIKAMIKKERLYDINIKRQTYKLSATSRINADKNTVRKESREKGTRRTSRCFSYHKTKELTLIKS